MTFLFCCCEKNFVGGNNEQIKNWHWFLPQTDSFIYFFRFHFSLFGWFILKSFMSILWSLAVLFLAEWRLSGARRDDDTRQCVSLTSLTSLSLSLQHTLTQQWRESGKEKTWQIHVQPPQDLWSTTCSVRDAFCLWIVEVGRHGQRGGWDHFLRDGPQRVRGVLPLLHVPCGLSLHNWPDTLESLPQVQQ